MPETAAPNATTRSRRERPSVHRWVGSRWRTLSLVLLVLQCGSTALSQEISERRYQWRAPRDLAGGNCTGFVVHPRDPNVRYVASGDIGGYRWDATQNRWLNFTDWNPDRFGGYMSGLAVDPDDPRTVYYAAGNGPGDIYRSSDGGKTFEPARAMNADNKPLFVKGGEDSSTSGERLVVDPSNPSVLLYASRLDGLFISTDRASPGSWRRIDSFVARGDIDAIPERDGHPARKPHFRGGLQFVAIDPGGGTTEIDGVKRSRVLYVGVGGDRRVAGKDGAPATVVEESGLWRSRDGGITWTRLTGDVAADEHPARGVVGVDGTLWTTLREGVYRVDRDEDRLTKLDVPPGPVRCFAIAVDPKSPGHVVVGRYGTARREHSYDERNQVFRSTDYGRTWEALDLTFESPGWWGWFLTPTHWMLFDPHSPVDEHGRSVRFFAGDWIGPWLCENLGAPRPHFELLGDGRGGMYVTAMAAPPAMPGHAIAPLFTQGADFDGFRYVSFSSVPTRRLTQTPGRNDGIADGASVAFCEGDPRFVAVVGGWQHGQFGGGGSSRDNGRTWQPFEGKGLAHPGLGRDIKLGRIAVGCQPEDTGVPRLVWIPRFKLPRFSTDFGKTWSEGQGAPAGMTPSEWDPWKTLVADPVEPLTFYAFDNNSEQTGEGRFFRTADGGKTWQHVGGVKASWKQRRWTEYHLIATPGVRGELWLTLHDPYNRLDQEPAQGLFRSMDGGATWQRVTRFHPVHGLAIGRPARDDGAPLLVLSGSIDGKRGIFVSHDAVSRRDGLHDAKFERIWAHDDPDNFAVIHCLRSIAADRQVPGRVYAGATGTGRGLFVGDVPVDAKPQRPAMVEATPVVGGVKLEWSDAPGADTYDVFRAARSDATNGKLLVEGLRTSHFDDQLDAGDVATAHVYRVVARNRMGASDPSAPVVASALAKVAVTGRFGSPGLNNETYDRASDGDVRTAFDAADASGGYTAISTRDAAVVRRIRFYPRGFEGKRMKDGQFQVADQPTGPWRTILEIPAGAPNGQWSEADVLDAPAGRYFRYLGADGSHCNIAEMEFFSGGEVSYP